MLPPRRRKKKAFQSSAEGVLGEKGYTLSGQERTIAVRGSKNQYHFEKKKKKERGGGVSRRKERDEKKMTNDRIDYGRKVF